MADIISIATAVPAYRHKQQDILHFMQEAHHLDDTDKRKLAFLYKQSGIDFRYSVLPDFSLPPEQSHFVDGGANGNAADGNAADGSTNNNVAGDRTNGDGNMLSIDARLAIYKQEALPLSLQAIEKCLAGVIAAKDVTHLITVSCTGMSAPGLDLEIIEALELSPGIFRTSVNFMGCYAAVHALKLGKMICDTDAKANVLIVSTELCTLHFQEHFTQDNAAAALLFADGCAAVLLGHSNNIDSNSDSINGRYSDRRKPVISLDSFCSSITFRGKQEMAWGISSKGFLMTLSGYVPQLIQEDISGLVQDALQQCNIRQEDIGYWCIHPGGRKILDTIGQKLQLQPDALCFARTVLQQYGNMSSPTILFVLKEIMEHLERGASLPARIFGVAFGPGLTMETFIASVK